MKIFIKFLSLSLFGIPALWAIGSFLYKLKFNRVQAIWSHNLKANNDPGETYLRLKQKSSTLADYAKANDYNERYCFLIDMKIDPGKKRFFVYDLQKDSVERGGLVTHGSGSYWNGEKLYCSNIPGSNCTSLGKYKIGNHYVGKFGLAYKLYGLDKSNSKAFERFVVLHGHECVPADEVYPLTICRSQGCPTVSPVFLKSLKKYIDASEKPILLNINN